MLKCRRAAAIVAVVIVAGTVCASEPPATGSPKEDIPALIRQLGDSQFVRREDATERLLRVGLAALDHLEQGAKHPDREIRYRCQRLLTLVRESDRRTRLSAFTSRSKPPAELDLPGWEHFSQRFGDVPESRELYAEMLAEEWSFLENVYGSTTEAAEIGQLLAERCQVLKQNQQYGLPLGSMATMYAVASEFPEVVSNETTAHLCSFCYRPTLQRTLTPVAKPTLVRQIVGSWVQQSADSQGAYQVFFLALRYNLREAAEAADRALADPGLLPQVKHVAIQVLARFGGPEHYPTLEKLLGDKTAFTRSRNGPKTETQIRDVALAAIIQLHKQDVRQFGFTTARRSSGYFFDPTTLGFATDEQRETALAKWREFQNR